jgi:hypothetical protein
MYWRRIDLSFDGPTIRNYIFDTFPCIIHHPTKLIRNSFFLEDQCGEWVKLMNHFTKNGFRCEIRDDIKILTANSRQSLSPLEKNLDLLGIEYEVLGRGESNTWTNRNKPRLICDRLKSVKEKYVLFMDADDVLVVRDLCDIVDRFMSFGCRMLFNASSWAYPLESRYSSIEKLMVNSPFCHLNSGCFIGESEFCVGALEKWLEFNDKTTDSFLESDQIKMKPVYIDLYPDVQIDYNCSIFQILDLESPNFVRLENFDSSFRLFS